MRVNSEVLVYPLFHPIEFLRAMFQKNLTIRDDGKTNANRIIYPPRLENLTYINLHEQRYFPDRIDFPNGITEMHLEVTFCLFSLIGLPTKLKKLTVILFPGQNITELILPESLEELVLLGSPNPNIYIGNINFPPRLRRLVINRRFERITYADFPPTLEIVSFSDRSLLDEWRHEDEGYESDQ